jgi:hypothetical protein
VPAAKAAWSRTTPRNPAPASFATVSPRSPRRRMPRPRPGVGGTGAWARRDRMWGRLLERSRSLAPFGEGVGVAPPPVPRKAGAPVLLMYALAPSKRRHTPPRTPRHPRAVPAKERGSQPQLDPCLSPRRMLEPSAEPPTTRAARAPKGPRLGSRRRHPPRGAQRRQAGPPEPRLPAVLLAPGEHRRAPRSRIRAWRRPGVSTSQPSPCGALLPDR